MEVLSKSQFAKAHGVSRAAVTQAVKRGAIKETPEGKVLLHHPVTVEWARSRTPKGNLDTIYAAVKDVEKSKGDSQALKAEKTKTRKAETVARKATTATAKATKESQAKQAEIDENDAAAALVNGGLGDGDGFQIPPLADIDPAEIWRYPKASLDKLRIFEVAKKTQQDREQKRGELILRELVKSLLAKIHAVDANEWRTLEERLIPVLCSVVGISDDDPKVIKIQKAINKETTQILRHTRRLIDTFLEKHVE